jgi:hypothetical protein
MIGFIGLQRIIRDYTPQNTTTYKVVSSVTLLLTVDIPWLRLQLQLKYCHLFCCRCLAMGLCLIMLSHVYRSLCSYGSLLVARLQQICHSMKRDLGRECRRQYVDLTERNSGEENYVLAYLCGLISRKSSPSKIKLYLFIT